MMKGLEKTSVNISHNKPDLSKMKVRVLANPSHTSKAVLGLVTHNWLT